MSNINLNKYASFAEYYDDTRPVGEHNVSYVGNEYVIYDDEEMYDMQGNKIINFKNYLNFYMPNGGTISLNKTGSPTVVELEYLIVGTQNWITWTETNNVRTLTLTAGQKVYIRNTSETSTGFSVSGDDRYAFEFSDTVYAGGNVNSLLCKIPNNAACTNNCYNRLFRYCSQLVLTDTFTLPFTTLTYGCYELMFYLCTNVKVIYTNMTDISASSCLYLWLNGVAATGDFYCPAELTISEGASGIPPGWTRHDI